MRGYNLVEMGHGVPLLVGHYTAATGTTTITSEFFDLALTGRAQMLVQVGTVNDTLTLTVLESTSFSAGDGTAVAFSLYEEADSGGDVVAARIAASATGYQLSGTANTWRVVDVNPMDLTDGSQYLGLQVAGVGTAGSIISAFAFLTGFRDQRAISPTQTS